MSSNRLHKARQIYKPFFFLLLSLTATGCRSTSFSSDNNPVAVRIPLTQIDSTVNKAIEHKVFPGAVVKVIYQDSILYHQAFGNYEYDQSNQVDTTSVFDVASITKVMATTLAVMGLHDEGRLNIYDTVAKYIPEFDTPEKRRVTIYQLLIHTSGLPAFRVYVDQLQTRKELVEAIKNEPLIQSPGEYLYSDLGLILCGLIVEKITKEPFDVYLYNNWFNRLGLTDTAFNPRNRDAAYLQRVLPTEIDTVFRKKRIVGEVHDERAWYMDGIAGHAGLFSTSTDIGKFAKFLLNHGQVNSDQLISAQVVKNFTSRQAPLRRRAIGFDLKSMDGFSSAGTLASKRTFGHTGFTGTSFWADPENNLVVIILTNRTFPHRSNASGIAQVRSDVADIVQLYILQ